MDKVYQNNSKVISLCPLYANLTQKYQKKVSSMADIIQCLVFTCET